MTYFSVAFNRLVLDCPVKSVHVALVYLNKNKKKLFFSFFFERGLEMLYCVFIRSVQHNNDFNVFQLFLFGFKKCLNLNQGKMKFYPSVFF